MAYQALGLGSTANDGTGDDLRTGGDKINDNFVEIYTKIGTGSALTADTVALLAAAQTFTNKVLTAPSINGVVGGTTTSQTITTLTAGSITGASGNFDINPATQILEIQGDGDASSSGVEGQIRLNCSNNNHGQTIKPQPHSAGVTNTMLLPAGASSTLVSLVSTDTLTNKTLTSPTITGTGAIAGTFTGNITGNVLGNVTGNVTGTVDGIVGGTTPAAVTGTAISGTSMAVTGTAGAMTLNTVTTTQRNALTAAVGMIVYNSTDSKIQAYAGSAWVDLH